MGQFLCCSITATHSQHFAGLSRPLIHQQVERAVGGQLR